MSNAVRCSDPSREDMVAFLLGEFGDDDSEFDREEAIYWFSSDWYSGQGSNLYAALSASPYRPGILANGCEPGGMSAIMYDALEREYVNG